MDSGNTTNSSASRAPSPSTSATSEGLAPLKLDVKYVDSRYKEDDATWEHSDTTDLHIPAELVQPIGNDAAANNNSWDDYCFVVIRKHSMPHQKPKRISFEIVVKSPYLVKACKDVIGRVQGISWDSEPLTLDPQLLVSYVPRFEQHEKELAARTRSEEDERVLASLRVLLDYLHKNYRQTLARIASLVSHGEITFDLLYAVLLPGTIVVRRCPVTRETRAARLLSADKLTNNCGQEYYMLSVEGLELAPDGDVDEADGEVRWGDDDSKRRFGMLETNTAVRWFQGVEKIHSLAVYPLAFHPQPEALTAVLLERARRWAALSEVHHVHYKGTASRMEWAGGRQRLVKYSVNSRIMVDKASFARMDSDYDLPTPNIVLPASGVDELTVEQLLLASPIVYGFSFSDKMWLEYNVNLVSPIVWNDEAFEGLVLPDERKTLLRSLIEANGRLNAGAGAFDDFVRGKGQGLVINLFGPPGVGKTLSAEATSEHLRRPLYIVGSGDLGTNAHALDKALNDAFELAACWNAVLLIDEADVFLEQRSLHDMERNAMVAVFLRHVEYYRGILFLTTNRIKTFDEAFLSRIHVALHFSDLSAPTKAQIWRAFLRKAGIDERDLTDEVVQKLSGREINGRQIKNACRTAVSLALSRSEGVRYEHLAEALNAMDEFLAEFAAMQEVK